MRPRYKFNGSSSERIGFFLFCAFLGTLAWSLHSGAHKSDSAFNRAIENSNHSASLPAPIDSPTPCCNDKPHLLIGTYYSGKNGQATKLLLNNKGPDPLTANPTLFSMSGQRFDPPAVTIDGHSFRMIDISPWISAAGLPFEEGSIEVFHYGKDLVLGAQVYIEDANHSLSFDEKLVEAKTFKSTRLEGLWWLPSQKGQVLLALSNNSDASLTASVQSQGRTPQRDGQQVIALAPHETRLFDVQADLMHHANGAMSRFGGLSINYTGSPGALYARAMAQDLSIGYSLAIQFSDPAAGKSSQLQGVGLRLGFAGGEALNQISIIRNVGDSNTTVTGRVAYTDQGGTTNRIPVDDLHLSASEMVFVDLGRLLGQHGHHHPDAVGSLELEYSAPKGSVIATTLSVSGSGNQVFRVPMWDIYGLRSSTGGYPWSIEGNSSTFVYIKNSVDNQQYYFMNVHFDGGDYQIGRKPIEAGQTVIFDLRKLRDEQVPDIHGQKIPLTVNSGQIHWTKTGIEEGVLIGRSEQVDSMSGISSNYACANCCDDSATNGRIVPNSASKAVGESYSFVAMDDLQDCYGYPFPQEIYAAEWTTSNENVATVSVGQATAAGPGTATITASFYDDRHVVVLCGGGGGFGGPPPEFGSDCCEPRAVHFTPSASFTVKPTLSGNATIWWFNDYDSPNSTNYPLVSTLTASEGGSGSYTYRITSGSDKAGLGPDLASSYVTSSNQVEVKSRKGSTNANDVVITVERNGQTSAPFHITVRCPSYIQQDSIDYQAVNAFGFVTVITYSVWDNLNTKLPHDVPVNEYFTTGIIKDYEGTNWTRSTPNGAMTGSITFTDSIGIDEDLSAYLIDPWIPTPQAPSSNLSQTRVTHFGQQFWIGTFNNGTGVLVQNDTLAFYLDHGAHEDRVSPVP